VTRVADITGLDRIGIPTYCCVRPLAQRCSVTVTCGKGLRRLDAKVGAAMEAIEYYSSEPSNHSRIVARASELEGAYVNPVALILPSWAGQVHTGALEWIAGWDLCNEARAWVPANTAFFPYDPKGSGFLFTPTTNGLAAGNTIEESICHGLAELIERDAWSLACARLRVGFATDKYPSLDPKTMPRAARCLVERFRQSGVELFVRVITSDVGLAAFHACSLEKEGASQFLAHEGMGAHPDAEVALIRAITEVAQSRAADIQGSREDLRFWRARGLQRIDGREWVFQRSTLLPFEEIPSYVFTDVLDDICLMLRMLQRRGLPQCVAVDLTRPEIGIPVVRMVVPGLEISSVDPWRVGPRVLAQLVRDESRIAQPSATF